jgi:hypothetical protein
MLKMNLEYTESNQKQASLREQNERCKSKSGSGELADFTKEVKNYSLNHFVRLGETIFALMRTGLRKYY